MQVALVILDGWGLAPDTGRNAVETAATPTVDAAWAAGPTGTLIVSGRTVGLPDGQMGNSEVGHLTIGAGRVIPQEFTRINDAIAAMDPSDTTEAVDPPLDRNPAITGALDHVQVTGGRLHLLGLIGDGGVHASASHLEALVDIAARADVPVTVHAFTDGRDTDPTDGMDHIETVTAALDDHPDGHVATVIGRYHAMDRDENWERTHRAYEAIVDRNAQFEAQTPEAAIAAAYDRDTTDEFIDPTLISGGSPLSDGDAALVFNFRADRVRQLTRQLGDISPDDWRAAGFETDPPDCHLVTMTAYDETFDLPVAFGPQHPTDSLGAVIAAAELTQTRIAESEKYPHVTYFLNGGQEREFPGERRHIVPSPDVPTYDAAPAMSAASVTDTAIEEIESVDPDVLIVNYANPDMVGHTGDFDAAVAAVEAVDTQLDRLLSAVLNADGTAIITADHGNAEEMGTPADPHTAHTTNPVPLMVQFPNRSEGTAQVRDNGTLADIAPTILSVLGLDLPAAMTGMSLLDPQP